MFEALLLAIVIMLSIVVFFGYLNEKTIQLPTEVGLLLAGLLISVIVLVLQKAGVVEAVSSSVPSYLLNDFLINGVRCFGIARLLGLDRLGFSQCLLLGCIISPTDPIAAMSILKKVGLPEDVALAIEGEERGAIMNVARKRTKVENKRYNSQRQCFPDRII